MKNYLKHRKGFTLVEILTVIMMIMVLATFTVMQFSSVQSRGRDAKRKSDIYQYSIALELYAKNNGVYPFVSGPSEKIQTLCTAISLSPCAADPKWPASHPNGYNYSSNGSGSRYVLIAHMENVVDSTNGTKGPGHYYYCSSGVSGALTYNPGPSPDPQDGVCPSQLL